MRSGILRRLVDSVKRNQQRSLRLRRLACRLLQWWFAVCMYVDIAVRQVLEDKRNQGHDQGAATCSDDGSSLDMAGGTTV